MVTRTEFWLGAIALAGVLLVDVLQGMIIGVAASLVYVIYRSSRPHVAELGRVPGMPGAYTDRYRHPECTPVPGVLIVRVDGPLYFANALTIRERIETMLAPVREFCRRSGLLALIGEEQLFPTVELAVHAAAATAPAAA